MEPKRNDSKINDMFEEKDSPSSCSDASDCESRPNSGQSLKRMSPQNETLGRFDQSSLSSVKKQSIVDASFSLSRSTAFPTFPSVGTPLFLSPAMFKPIISGGINQRPLNLSIANATVEPSAFSPSHSTNQCSVGSISISNQNELLSNNQIIRNSVKRPSPGLLCVVCGDTSSGKHYGILACNGCSGFFKRSVRRKLIYRCQAGTGNCVIDKQHRNQCQACRLRKCVTMGMNKEAVQNERQPRNTATIRPETLLNDSDSERLLREGVAATVAAVFASGTGLRSLPNNRCSSISFASQSQIPDIRAMGSLSRNMENGIEENNAKEIERNRIGQHFEYNNPSSYHLSIPTNSIGSLSSSFGYASEQAFNAMIQCNSESIYETSARLLFMAVKWAKNLPSFTNLTFRDQVILLEESWSELFLLCAIQWCMPMEKCPMFSLSNVTEGGDHSSDIRVLTDTLNRYRTAAVDPAEFACLKALALFKPEARGLKDVTRIEHMQDQAQMMLMQHVKAHHPTNPMRFGRLLLSLLSLRMISADKIADIYFQRTIGNTPMEKLLCDMFKC